MRARRQAGVSQSETANNSAGGLQSTIHPDASQHTSQRQASSLAAEMPPTLAMRQLFNNITQRGEGRKESLSHSQMRTR